MNIQQFFHYVSYLQYPLMLIAMYFVFKPYFHGFEKLAESPDLIFQDLNSVLIFMGLAVSFSSLQDTTKTQNEFSRKVWQDPKKGKVAIAIMSLMILFLLIVGLIAFFIASDGFLKDLSVGIIVFSLGLFGILKTAIEMFENHRLDKNNTVSK
jgi:hypothetical protein